MRPINQTPQSADGAYERETIINFCDAEKTCSYYTRNYSRMNELRKLATEHPDEVKLTIDKEDCVEAEFPKKWVKIRPPMFISEERRAIVQAECRVWAGDWLHHWPVLPEPHLQHDSGVRSVSVLRYPAGWLLLRPDEAEV